jgi:hypothetical protein
VTPPGLGAFAVAGERLARTVSPRPTEQISGFDIVEGDDLEQAPSSGIETSHPQIRVDRGQFLRCRLR